MKKLLLLFIMMSGFAFGQTAKFSPPPKINDFRFTNGKMTESCVIDIPNTKKETIYKRIIEYLKQNYVNYDEVVSSEIENEMIRFQGISYRVLNFGNLHENDGLYYMIQIDIKDDKIKLTPQIIKTISEDNSKNTLDLPLEQSVTNYGVKYDFKDIPVELNRISDRLTDYIKNGKKANW